jgi:DNA polymerase
MSTYTLNSQKRTSLEALFNRANECYQCAIRLKGHNIVFGNGDPNADLMIIGEAPGYNEHIDGLPFTGKAGKLLNSMLVNGMGLKREEVYVCNILKCRPPENRDPDPVETENCTAWLEEQIKIVAPKVIMAMGKYATCYLLGKDPSKSRMGDYCGNVYNSTYGTVVPVWHTAFLLRRPEFKRDTQQHCNVILGLLGKDIVMSEYPT